jgi:hypothetical protein
MLWMWMPASGIRKWKRIADLQGFGRTKLSDTVVLAVIGSTTVNLLGILYIVANDLFPKRGKDDQPPKP